ncbi:YdiK family protein [Heyndrickxia acidicola]|uniref:YdiK family protein n=1 Tax=Heyndrickxia acidicola TaxID=209389 RepID=A0ABU6MDF9_9BACI|nr:YdiK family protein [Heyndrickxia acidicola]MED1202688.1 YdiK family protein [Heyndrickxia acidicola]
MRPLFSGVFYCLLGILFTYFATQQVQSSGWGLFPFLIIFLATLDLGAGIKIIAYYILIRNQRK